MQKKDEETTDRLKPLRDWLDVAAKSAIAGITIWFGFLASDYKSKVEATTLLSERERAESDLRAGMMRDLVPRFIEQQSGQSPSDLHRARVFLELLTLNFHTHMEMKPLLLELDSRIAGQLNRKQNKSDLDQLEGDRRDLRSVARRVLDRQVEMLAASEAAAVPASTSSQGSEQPVPRRSLTSDIWFRQISKLSDEDARAVQRVGSTREASTFKLKLNSYDHPASFVSAVASQPVCAIAPDETHALLIRLWRYDPDAGTARIDVRDEDPGAGCTSRTQRTAYSDPFTLTPYDFPLTDNARLESDPKQRYSLNLYRILPEEKSKEKQETLLQLRLVWLPAGYITERERPMNYADVRKALDLQ